MRGPHGSSRGRRDECLSDGRSEEEAAQEAGPQGRPVSRPNGGDHGPLDAGVEEMGGGPGRVQADQLLRPDRPGPRGVRARRGLPSDASEEVTMGRSPTLAALATGLESLKAANDAWAADLRLLRARDPGEVYFDEEW